MQVPPFQAATSNPCWLMGIKTGSVKQWIQLNQLPGKSYPQPEGIAHVCTLSSLLVSKTLSPEQQGSLGCYCTHSISSFELVL